MKSFACNDCDLAFQYESQLTRHLGRKIPCSGIRIIKCDLCNIEFTTTSALKKHNKRDVHMKMVNKAQIIEKDIETKKNEIKELQEQLKEVHATTINNDNKTLNNNNTVNNNNLTVNLLTKDYIIQNYNNDSQLKELENYGSIKSGPLVDNTTNQDENNAFVNTIITQEKCGKLVKYFSDIIVSFYQKQNDLSQQAFWCSDLARLNFLVRVLPMEESHSTWRTDPSGVIVKNRVITPLLSFVEKCIDDYTIKNSHTIAQNIEKHIKLGEIVKDIRNDVLTNQIAKYIAPKFAYGKHFSNEDKKRKNGKVIVDDDKVDNEVIVEKKVEKKVDEKIVVDKKVNDNKKVNVKKVNDTKK